MSDQINDTSISDSLPTMDKAARYQILIVGKMEPSWSDRLGGMQITIVCQAGKRTITALDGLMVDQCALSGVLTTLCDLQFPILSLKYIKEEDGKKGRMGSD